MRQLDEKWTPAQRDAIRARGETLLVFAAAGSGKTAVLTERIIDRLLDDENALDLSSVLVVTFTKAAAAELKTRIRAALDAEIANAPENKRLQTQLLNVGRAKICTIDSFCLDLIRSHFDTLGLSPRVSVSDEAEAKLLAKNVMNDLIDDYFDGNITKESEQIADFGAFTDLFVTSRSSAALAEVLLEVRETVNGYEEGIGWLYRQAEMLRGGTDASGQADFFSCDLGRGFLGMLASFASSWNTQYEKMCAYLSEDDVYIKNYGDCLTYEKEWCGQLGGILSRDIRDGTELWDTLRSHFLNFDAPGLKTGIRGDKKTDEILQIKERHAVFGAQRKTIAERYFTVSGEELRLLNREQAAVIEKLALFLSVFERRLTAEKNRRQTLCFDDLGRLALRLLWDGERACPTETAQEEAAHYSEIYIDEYQDVSPVQDRIFSAIANTDNRFMVGDAKQSIYGFRGASPELFLGYRTAFAAHPDAGRTIFLSDNFRCDRHIIDFANRIFSVLFGNGDVPYTEDDALRCSKLRSGTETEGQKRVSLAVIRSGKEETDDADENVSAGTIDSETDETEDAAAYTEADYVADTVCELLRNGRKHDGSRIRPRDIAILLRSAKSSAAPIAKALEARKIPSFNSVSRAFFENAEVLLIYSLLSVIDNPGRDVYLAGVLKSPLYRVTLDELIHMRTKYPHGSLYDALCAFTKETGYAKGTYFLDKLQHYRRRAEGMPVDRFLWYLYQDTGVLSLIYEKEKHELFAESPDSAQMRANLMMFYEYARSFERGGFQGLYQFVAFIGNVIEEKAQMPPVLLSGEDADAVRIMTVHQSKGLEFPVCFLCGCGKRFNDSDTRKTVLLSRSAGIATYLRDETGLARINHPVRECIRSAISDGAREEEKRVLYVALTRARERLYLTASAEKPFELSEKYRFYTKADMTRENLAAAGNILTWLFMALAVAGDDVCDISFPTENPYANQAVSGSDDTSAGEADAVYRDADPGKPASQEDAHTVSYRAAKRRFDDVLSYRYPDAAKTGIPSKMSVSDLQKLHTTAAEGEPISGQDEAAETEDGLSASVQTRTYAVPFFMQNSENDRATAAQRGTATHEFMQFCDLTALADETLPRRERIEREIRRLTEADFITQETAERMDRGSLSAFLKSTLFEKLIKAKEIRREMRFNLYVPASRVFPEIDDRDTRVLVQGIIDCYYTDRMGRVILIDYKTDHFSRTALSDPASVEQILRKRHGGQLSYYCEAAEQLLCRPVYDVRIYSFALGYDFSVL